MLALVAEFVFNGYIGIGEYFESEIIGTRANTMIGSVTNS